VVELLELEAAIEIAARFDTREEVPNEDVEEDSIEGLLEGDAPKIVPLSSLCDIFDSLVTGSFGVSATETGNGIAISPTDFSGPDALPSLTLLDVDATSSRADGATAVLEV